MSIALRRLSYAVQLTPQVKQKKRSRLLGREGAFFAERVAVLRQSNSHARPRAERSFYEVERRASSVQRQPKKRNKVKQINKRQSRLFRGVPIEVDGWAKEQPLKKQVAVDANTVSFRFFGRDCVADKVATTKEG